MRISLLAFVSGALLLTGCPAKKATVAGACAQDLDCGPEEAWRCEVETGACFCETDQACAGGDVARFCNTAGFCQDRAGCEKNADCLDPLLFCETSSGSCLSRGRCSSDLHCGFGQVCDTGRSLCVDGCRSHSDCKGQSCRCPDNKPCVCNATDEAGRQACALGTCDPNWCADDSFCRFREFCGTEDSGTPNVCYSDFDPDRRPYCTNCSSGGGVQTCGQGANYCLINQRGGSSFCGADCSEGQKCPRGYECGEVVVVSGNRCTPQAPACPIANSLPCQADEQCPRGGVCAKASPDAGSGFCAGRCALGEGAVNGFCTCLVDSDCAQDRCLSNGECAISRKACVDDSNCRKVSCVDFNGVGGCYIGDNCVPRDGLTCTELNR